MSGNGVSAAIVRSPAEFRIHAHDASGAPVSNGGDAFFVAIHGRGVRVRAKVTDNGDGTHDVRYLCTESGVYLISISLYGEGLPGSPFTCRCSTPTPSAPFCVVSGNALQKAIARQQQFFEIQFRDAQGNIAHAEEVDVYVEFVEPTPLASQSDNKELELEVQPGTASPSDSPKRRGSSASSSASFNAGSKKSDSSDVLPTDASMQPELQSLLSKSEKADKAEQEQLPPSSPFHAPKIPKLLLSESTEYIVTCKSPLIVRAGLEMNSPKVGQLRPGRKVTLLKVQESQGGNGEESVRACISLEAFEPLHRAEVKAVTTNSWRDAYPERPQFWDELNLGSPRSPRSFRRQVPLGWITVAKAGREMLTPRSQLHAGARQRHMSAWARRQAVDRSLAGQAMSHTNKKEGEIDMKSYHSKVSRRSSQITLGKKDKSIYLNELRSDPDGIGFAYGGVEPGKLHAGGKLVDTHKVYYSIAVCGMYRLHIGLRHQALPVPGSPFTLTVTPGQAHAISTELPKSQLPLRGVVGVEEGEGCRVRLYARDKMGNQCTSGGAKIVCNCTSQSVNAEVLDQNDGSYILQWSSKDSGVFEVSVTIDGIPINGSPTSLKLVSGSPDLTKTVVSGSGLGKIQAGKPTSVLLKLLDEHENVAIAPPSFQFGLKAIRPGETGQSKDSKDVWRSQRSDDFVGEWENDEYTMRYSLKMAGELDLHLWCADMSNKSSTRQALPGSPFKIQCVAGRAHAAGSYVDSFTKADATIDKQQAKKQQGKGQAGQSSGGQTAYEEQSVVRAGETINFKPQIRDQYGNPAAALDGALAIEVVDPSGQTQPLTATVQMRSGLTTYEARYEPRIQGDFTANIMLSGAPIKGSPIHFRCEASVPDPTTSYAEIPQSPYFATIPVDVVLRTVDKFGNKCTRGGHSISGRLMSGAQALPHGQDATVPVEDRGDGSYVLKMLLITAAEVKLVIVINSEKERAAGQTTTGSSQAVELTPIPFTFLSAKQKDKAGNLASKDDGKKMKAEKGKHDKKDEGMSSKGINFVDELMGIDVDGDSDVAKPGSPSKGVSRSSTSPTKAFSSADSFRSGASSPRSSSGSPSPKANTKRRASKDARPISATSSGNSFKGGAVSATSSGNSFKGAVSAYSSSASCTNSSDETTRI